MNPKTRKTMLLLVTVLAVCISLLLRGELAVGAGRPSTGAGQAEGHGLTLSGSIVDAASLRLPAFEVPLLPTGPVNGPARLAGDVPVTIGTLPAGKSVTIVFDVTVNSPLTGTASQACNQGTVTATSPAASIVTNDPATVAVDDPTCIDLGRPDLTATKTNTVGGTVAFPGSWDWRIDVANPPAHGPGTFSTGQVILRDDLPNTGVSYTAPVVSLPIGISGGGTISCAIVTFTLTCTASGGTVVIADPGSFRVTTTATPTVAGTFANPRAGGACAVDPDLHVVELNEGNNTCADTVVVTAPDLTATKTNTVGGATTLGNTWDWRVDVANPGTAAAMFASGQVILRDNLPNTNITYSAPTVSNLVGISGTGTISCAIVTFDLTCTASGGNVVFAASTGSFRATTTATPTATATFANPRVAGVCAADPDLVVGENNEGNNACADSVVVTVPDLTATKTDTVSGATTLGNPWDWRIDVANGGSGPATFALGQVILLDNLPNTNVSYSAPAVSLPVGISGTGTISCTIVTFNLSCTASGGTVIIAAAGSFRVTTTATPTATGSFANPRGGGVCAADPNLVVVELSDANNACTGSVTVTAPDLTATKTNTVSGATTLGNPWDWRIDVANGGSGPATFALGQVILLDNLPNTNVSYSAPTVSNLVGIGGTGTISCTIVAFNLSCTASGGTVIIAAAGSFRVTTTATPTATGTFANPRGGGVCAVDPNLLVVENSEVNNACSDSVAVTSPDLLVAKSNTVSGATTLGNSWDWRLDVANGGTGTATFASGQVLLRDQLPASNIVYTAPVVSLPVGIGGSGTIGCALASQTITCSATGGTVTVAAAGGFRVTTTASPTGVAAFTNPRPAGVCAVDPDGNITESNEGNNNCNTDTVTVTAPDLTATKTNTVAGATLFGTSWDWRIDVNNGGSGTATFASGDVVLLDQLPNVSFTYTAPALSNLVGIGGTGTLSCAIASFNLTCTASGGTVTIAIGGGFRVTTTATPAIRGMHTNPRAGGVCAVDPDLNSGEADEANNGCADSVTVTGPDLTATKTGPPGDQVILGQSWEWRIDVANVGDAPAIFPSGTVVVIDDLPVGTISYTGPTLSNQSGLGGAGTLSCVIASNTLTCTATGGTVTLAGPTGTFRVAVIALPTAPGSYTNPRPTAFAAAGIRPLQAGECAVDPDGAVPESDNVNNNCSNTVTVRQTATAARVLSFTAQANKLGVDLDWQTATEVDVLGFIVERAGIQNGVWEPVQRLVPAQGSAAAGARYQLHDLPEPGLYLYRLKVVDARPGVAPELFGPEMVKVWSRPAFLPHLAK